MTTTTTDPRTVQSRQKVLDVAGSLLCEHGINNVSVELISKESGVAKTTIYRQWENLDDIVFDVLKEAADPPKFYDTGSVVDDTKASVRYLMKCLTEKNWSKMMPDMIERSMRDKKFKALKEKFMGERMQPLQEALQKGKDRGELKKSTDIDFVIHQIIGPIFMSYMGSGDLLTQKQADTVVNNTLANYLR